MTLQPLQLDALPHGSLIALDSAPLIYWLEDHPHWGGRYAPLLEGIAANRWRGLLTTVTLAEVLTGPLQSGREELVERYVGVFTNSANFQMASLSAAIAIGAARLRARYRLRLPDAVQLASALEAGALALVSHDRDFAGCTDLPILSAQA